MRPATPPQAGVTAQLSHTSRSPSTTAIMSQGRSTTTPSTASQKVTSSIRRDRSKTIRTSRTRSSPATSRSPTGRATHFASTATPPNITAIVVADDHQRTRPGTAFAESAVEAAVAAGAGRLWLATMNDYVDALRDVPGHAAHQRARARLSKASRVSSFTSPSRTKGLSAFRPWSAGGDLSVPLRQRLALHPTVTARH